MSVASEPGAPRSGRAHLGEGGRLWVSAPGRTEVNPQSRQSSRPSGSTGSAASLAAWFSRQPSCSSRMRGRERHGECGERLVPVLERRRGGSILAAHPPHGEERTPRPRRWGGSEGRSCLSSPRPLPSSHWRQTRPEVGGLVFDKRGRLSHPSESSVALHAASPNDSTWRAFDPTTFGTSPRPRR